MDKKICIISANCQGAYINLLLRVHPEFSQDFEIYYFVNYLKQIVPRELLKNADLLIYQPLGTHWGELSADYLEQYINSKAFKIRIPYLTFPLYFPFYTDDYRNIRTKAHPSGFYPYGDKLVLELKRKGATLEEVIKKLTSFSYIKQIFNPEKAILDYREFMLDIESRRDQKLVDFILDNFRDLKLFTTYNHPAPPLMVYQVNDILKKLGYKTFDYNEEVYKLLTYVYMYIYEQPIHPYVAELLNLRFECDWESPKYNIYGIPLNFKEFIEAYYYYDISKFGDALPEPNKSLITPMYCKRRSLNKEGKVKQIIIICLSSISSCKLMIYNIYSLFFGELSEEYKNKNLPGFFEDILHYLKDYNRILYKIVAGRVPLEVIEDLHKDENVKLLIVQNPVSRVIEDYKLGNEMQSLIEYVKEEKNKNFYTKLLGRKFNILNIWRSFVSGEIKTQEEYFSAIEEKLKLPLSEEEINRAFKNIQKFKIIGFSDKFNEFLKLFNKYFFNVEENHLNTELEHSISINVSEEEKKLIIEENLFDIKLFNYIRKIQNV